MLVKYPSLELNWLPNSMLKGLTLPEIRFIEVENASGSYTPPYKKNKPLITISTLWPEDIHETIAHEFRHHWQLYNVLGEFPDWPWGRGTDYKESIIDYFTGAWHEWDALQFSLKVAPTDVTLLWKEWINESNCKKQQRGKGSVYFS